MQQDMTFPTYGWVRSLGISLVAMTLLTACVVQPDPLTNEETELRIESDVTEMFANQPVVDTPLTLHEAMGRAILYNLDSRVRSMEQSLALAQLDLAQFGLLPSVTGSYGVDSRSNTQASSSTSITTGRQSLEPSTSVEDTTRSGDLGVVWNVLDFGVSYYSAKQQADRALIAHERNRKVIHDIIQDVRRAYWRAVAADRVLVQIDPLMDRVLGALNDVERIEAMALQSPLEALSYRRTLLEALQELETQRRELRLAKIELAALINLPPGSTYDLAMPTDQEMTIPDVSLDVAKLEELALAYRPELREEQLNTRISADEVRKALLRILPGLEFNAGINYDSNDFLVNKHWAEYGIRISLNLMNVFSAPAAIDAANADEAFIIARRQALSMAVLTQLYVALANYEESQMRYQTAVQINDVQQRITESLRSAGAGQAITELRVIQSELNALRTELTRDLSFAEVQNSFGQIFVAVGADPLPGGVDQPEYTSIATVISDTEQDWAKGQIQMLEYREIEYPE